MRTGVIAGMQADLMAALVDTAHQVADGGMLRFVLGIETGVGAAADEVEGATDAVTPADAAAEAARVALRAGLLRHTAHRRWD